MLKVAIVKLCIMPPYSLVRNYALRYSTCCLFLQDSSEQVGGRLRYEILLSVTKGMSLLKCGIVFIR